MTTNSSGVVDIHIDGAIAEITLNRPEALNSITNHMHIALKEAFLSVQSQPQVRAIVFAARGKAFSAGGNFDEILLDHSDKERRERMRGEGKALLLALADCSIPIVTALQGDAVGLGATLVLVTDAIVASRTARLSDPHVAIGLAAGDGGCVAWPQHIGMLRAKRYLLTGDRLGAEQAYAMGLVTDLVDSPEETLPAARALAARIAALPPLAVQNTKRTLNKIFRERIELAFEFGMDLEMETFVSNDLVEAIAAFRQKRKPSYLGR